MPEEKTVEEQEIQRPKEVKTLLEWESPERTFKRRDSKYFSTVGLLILVIAAIAIFIQEFLFIGVLLALFFVLYVFGTIEPSKVAHRITTQGITTGGHSYIWEDLADFWMTEKHGSVVVNVGTKIRYPARLIMLLPYLEREKVKETLVKHLPFREEPPSSWMDQAADWLNAKLPASLR